MKRKRLDREVVWVVKPHPCLPSHQELSFMAPIVFPFTFLTYLSHHNRFDGSWW